MQRLRKHVIGVGIVVVALAGGGAAAAAALTGTGPTRPHTNPGLRAFRSCPSRDSHKITSTTAGARAVLVPAGSRQVLLCRYSGTTTYPATHQRSLKLAAHRVITKRSTVKSLSNELNALRKLTGSYACANDNGAAIIAFFRYGSAAKSDDPVTIHLGGCSVVTNGHLSRLAGVTAPGVRLVRQLESLVTAGSSQ
ncbi:MAG: hypothetical protein ACRET5_15840 [Steroidobacteraceae bacterium]